MKIMKTAVAILLGSIVIACEREVVLDETFTENKLVVQSFISPQDTVITVRVSETKPTVGIVSSQDKWVANARVSLSDNQTSQIVPYDKFGYYRLRVGSFKIEPQRTYTLKVTTPDGRLAEATCIVPLPGIATKDVAVQINTEKNYQHQLTATWQDEISKANTYGLWFGFEKYNPICSTGKTTFINDLGKDGKKLTYTSNFDSICNTGERKVRLYMSVYDENFTKFMNTLNDQDATNGIPFTENIQVFSNVKNGYGIFAAYYVITTTISY